MRILLNSRKYFDKLVPYLESDTINDTIKFQLRAPAKSPFIVNLHYS